MCIHIRPRVLHLQAAARGSKKLLYNANCPAANTCWAWVPARAQHSCNIIPDMGPYKQPWHGSPTLPVSVSTPGTTSKSLLTSLNMGSSGRCFRANSRCSTGSTTRFARGRQESICGRTTLEREAEGSAHRCGRSNRGFKAADQHCSSFQRCAPRCTHLACVAGVRLPQHCVSIAGHHLARLERGPHKVLGLLHSGVVPKLQQVQSHAQAAAYIVVQHA